jgi:hypothetical protein
MKIKGFEVFSKHRGLSFCHQHTTLETLQNQGSVRVESVKTPARDVIGIDAINGYFVENVHQRPEITTVLN